MHMSSTPQQAVYEIWVKTGTNGLSSAVGLKLNDAHSKSVEFSLNDTDRNDFEAGNVDHFKENGLSLDGITTAEITSGPRDGDVWELDWIYILNHTTRETVFLTNAGAEANYTHLPHPAVLDSTLPAKLKLLGPLPQPKPPTETSEVK